MSLLYHLHCLNKNKYETNSRPITLFRTDPSLFHRQTIWGVLIGGYLYWTSFNSVNQTMVQRYMSLPNLKVARISTWIFTIGIGCFVTVCCYTGLLVFAAYYKCDPLTIGLVNADDQLLPMYVMQAAGHLHGIPGLFIAGNLIHMPRQCYTSSKLTVS